jgi:hypothetical protein
MQSKRKEPAKKRGRPATGKRSNEAYRQHSTWLSNALYAQVQKALVMPDGRRYEFSALAESLLRQWLKSGAKLPKE